MFDSLLTTLYGYWLYDMEVFSQPWIYYWALIPALCYLWFFVVKWIVVLLPIWMPAAFILSILGDFIVKILSARPRTMYIPHSSEVRRD